jgi:hypothetical protein
MKTPRLQLEEHALTRLHVDFISPPSGEMLIDSLESTFSYQVGVHNADTRRYRLNFNCKFEEACDRDKTRAGFKIDCEIVGLFLFDDDVDVAEREKLIRLNGVSVLYSTLRGILAVATGIFPGRRFLLPMTLPQEIVKIVEGNKQSTEAEHDTP